MGQAGWVRARPMNTRYDELTPFWLKITDTDSGSFKREGKKRLRAVI